MTYKELLFSVAEKATEHYKSYLKSKIDMLSNPSNELLSDQTEQLRDAYEDFEKKFGTLLAMVKNDHSLNGEVTQNMIDDYLKQI